MAPANETSDLRAYRPPSHPSEVGSRRQLGPILILTHPGFQAITRRRLLLRFLLVEETLAGRGAHLRGYAIALAVFDRDESFDPQAPRGEERASHLQARQVASSVLVALWRPHRIVFPEGCHSSRLSWVRPTGRAPAWVGAGRAATGVEKAHSPLSSSTQAIAGVPVTPAAAVPPAAPRR